MTNMKKIIAEIKEELEVHKDQYPLKWFRKIDSKRDVFSLVEDTLLKYNTHVDDFGIIERELEDQGIVDSVIGCGA